MTNDKQIDAAFEEMMQIKFCALNRDSIDETLWKSIFTFGHKAAIEAMQAQLDAERMELANRENAIFTAGQNFQREHGHDNVVPMLQSAYDVMEQAVDDMRDGYSVCPAVKMWMKKWMHESGIKSESGRAPDIDELLKYDSERYKPLVEALREVVRKTKQEQACIQELDSHVKSYAISQMHQLHQLASEALANLPKELRG